LGLSSTLAENTSRFNFPSQGGWQLLQRPWRMAPPAPLTLPLMPGTGWQFLPAFCSKTRHTRFTPTLWHALQRAPAYHRAWQLACATAPSCRAGHCTLLGRRSGRRFLATARPRLLLYRRHSLSSVQRVLLPPAAGLCTPAAATISPGLSPHA